MSGVGARVGPAGWGVLVLAGCGPAPYEAREQRDLKCPVVFTDPRQVALCHRFEEALELGRGHAQLIGHSRYTCTNESFETIYCANPPPSLDVVLGMSELADRDTLFPTTLLVCIKGLKLRMEEMAKPASERLRGSSISCD